MPAERPMNISEVVVKPSAFGHEGKSAAIGSKGLPLAPQAAERAALPVERFHPVGALRERTLEGIEGGLPTSLFRQRFVQIQRGLGVPGREDEDAPEALFRLR